MKRNTALKLMYGLGASLLAMQATGAVIAQDSDSDEALSFDEIVVTGSRLPTDLTGFAGSVTMLGQEELENQTRMTMDIGEILGNTVPGLAASKGTSASNFSQVLRGRKPAVLIDGAPQTVPMREAGRDLRIISPAAIGQIEIIRGSTALYGMGGAGGVINYITKNPTEEGYQFRTDVGFSSSLTNIDSESFSYQVSQSVTGKEGAFDFIVTALYEDVGQIFDANGDMIAPDPEIGQGGIAETETTSFFVKLGYDIDENQRLQGTYSRYRAAQDTDYFYNFFDTTTGYQTATLKSNLGVGGYEEGYIIDPRTDNDSAAISYSHGDVFGSAVTLSGTYQNYAAVFGNTPFFLWGLAPRETNLNGGGQTQLLSEKYGVRLDVNTPIEAVNGRILWGVDYLEDTTAQDIYDSGDYYLSPLTTKDLALYAQFDGDITDGVNIRGGFRWVNFKTDIDDYTTLPFCIDGYVDNGELIGCNTVIGGNTVTGGKLSYNLFLPNFGATVDVTENWNVFAAYSKGFIVADLGRTFRDLYFASDIGEIVDEPQTVESYEAGFRGTYETVSVEVAGYYSTSEAGSNYEQIGELLVITRAPERTWGAEISVDWQVNDALNIAANYSWVDGKVDPDDTGDFEQMTSFRIPPQKLVAQARYDISDDWSVFLQGLYSFKHDPEYTFVAPDFPTPGRFPLESFLVLDASVTGKVGPGYLSVSVANLLNNDYSPAVSQAYNGWDQQQFYKAPGAELSIRYSIEY